jgi:hypothetical protein
MRSGFISRAELELSLRRVCADVARNVPKVPHGLNLLNLQMRGDGFNKHTDRRIAHHVSGATQ